MTEEKTKENKDKKIKENKSVTTTPKTSVKAKPNASNSNVKAKAVGNSGNDKKTASARGSQLKQKKTFKKKFNKSKRNQQRSEFEQKVIDIRRVTRVIAGGRRFSFRVTVIVGDGKGKVGVGTDKGSDTAIAIEKAVNKAKKNMIKINLTESMSIPKKTQVKYNASEVMMRPSPGKGIVAGSAIRAVLQIAGVTDVVAKLLSRSGNKLNNSRVAIKALASLSE